MLAELAGFNHFLQKPFDTQVLLGLLEPLRAVPVAPGEDTTLDRSQPAAAG